MTSPDHILPYLDYRSFSATLDLSKYSHMFLTKEEEHKYIGLVHPETGDIYIYRTLPMETHNLPGASSRFGAALIRQAIETSKLFGGSPVDNSLQQYFSDKISHSKFGEDRVLFSPEGLSAVLLWLHVDDILIHTPNKSKLEAALTHILGTTIRLGIICHLSKTSSPSQGVKICGFEYDTSPVPTLYISQK